MFESIPPHVANSANKLPEKLSENSLPVTPGMNELREDIALHGLTLPNGKNLRSSSIQVEVVPRLGVDGTEELAVTLRRDCVEANLIVHGPDLNSIFNEDKPLLLFASGLQKQPIENPFRSVQNVLGHNLFALATSLTVPESERFMADFSSPEMLIESGLLAVDWVSEHKIGPIVLAGYSLGGYVAAHVAVARQDKLEALALLSPSFLSPSTSWFARNGYLPMAYAASWLMNKLGIGFDATGREMLSRDTLSALREVLKTGTHQDLFSKMDLPVQVSVGSRESISPRYLETLLNLLPHDEAELLVLRGVKHGATQEHALVAFDFLMDYAFDRDAIPDS